MCHCVQHCPSTGSPVTVGDIQKATRRGTILSKVYHCIEEGWRNKVLKELQPYKHCENELSTENGCIMWGMHVIAPQTLYPPILSLHANHPGIIRMKTIARCYFWWTGLDKAIEELDKSCQSCQANQASLWIWPDTP